MTVYSSRELRDKILTFVGTTARRRRLRVIPIRRAGPPVFDGTGGYAKRKASLRMNIGGIDAEKATIN